MSRRATYFRLRRCVPEPIAEPASRRRDSHSARSRSAMRSRPAGLSRNPVSGPERSAPCTLHQPGSVRGPDLTHTPSRSCPHRCSFRRSPSRLVDLAIVPVIKMIFDPAHDRGAGQVSPSRLDHQGLVSADTSTPAQRRGVDEANESSEYLVLFALRLIVGEDHHSQAPAATPSSCSALLVI